MQWQLHGVGGGCSNQVGIGKMVHVNVITIPRRDQDGLGQEEQ